MIVLWKCYEDIKARVFKKRSLGNRGKNDFRNKIPYPVLQ